MSADTNINQPNDATVGGPVLISDNSSQIYDLATHRKRHLNSDATESVSTACSDGVCVLSWKPRKPRNDAA